MRSKELVHIQYVVNETSIVCSEKMSARQSDCSYQNLSDKIIKFPTAALTNDCICCALPKKVINTHVCFFNTNAVLVQYILSHMWGKQEGVLKIME